MSKVYHAHQLPLFPSKVCSICGKEKLLDQFPTRKGSKDGFNGKCKNCKQQYQQAYYSTNRERLSQQHKEYRDAHREHASQKSREWHAAHKEYAHQRRQAYYALHQEQLQQNSRKYYHENKDRTYYAQHEQKLQQRRKYYASHREQYQQYQQEYIVSHREQRQQWSRRYLTSHLEQYRQASRRREAIKRNTSVGNVSYKSILEHDGYVCHICNGVIDPKDLHFDHVIPLSRGGPHTEDNIKPAHGICNVRKHNKLMEELTPFHRRGVT